VISKSGLNYIVVGAGGALVYLLLLSAFVELFNVTPVLAVVLSYIPVFIASYFLTHSWVFDSEAAHRLAFFRYLFVTGFGFLINTVGMFFAVNVLELWYLSSQIFLFVFVAINNYLLNRYWTFGKGKIK
jgi:putative flippase GtrA